MPESMGGFGHLREDGNLQMAVSDCFYSAPGVIRTPDLVVRSHALESALKAINRGHIVNEDPQISPIF